MEPLYRTWYAYTFEDYKKFSDRLYYSTRKWYIAAAAAIIVLSVVTFFLSPKRPYYLFFSIGLMAVYIAYMVIGHNIRNKKYYYANPFISDGARIDIAFFEDRMEIVSESDRSLTEYTKIYEIVETDASFYIMFTKQMGGIISKKNCTPELIVFLRELAAKRKLAKKKK